MSLRNIALAMVCACAVGALATWGWTWLPYPADQLRRAGAQSLVITDRNGIVLADRPLLHGGHARWRTLAEIPTVLINLTLMGEDRTFYDHSGVELRSIARATYLNVTQRELVFGGSTISMQLARMLHPHARHTLLGKISDVLYAQRLEHSLSKQALLEHYLNRAYYGHGAYGVEAAARVYFGRPCVELSAAEASLIAILPRAPSAYDLYNHRDAANTRRNHLLTVLHEHNLLAPAEHEQILAMTVTPRLPERLGMETKAPHFVDYVIAQLPSEVTRYGGVVRTSLDWRLQTRVEQLVREHVSARQEFRVMEAGALVLDPQRGTILAMVGSPDYNASQLNAMTMPRGPGSTLKPFIYALAIEAGDHPSSIAWDTRDFPSEYINHNPDLKEHGPVPYRVALSSSYNLAAVHTAERVGLDRVLARLRLAGLDTLTGDALAYGPALAIGRVRARPIDVAAAYEFLVRDGEISAPQAILDVRGADGVLRQTRVASRRIFSEETSWLAANMLSDATARRPGFGEDLPFDLPFPVIAKTGTSAGFADNHAIIATRELLVAAWAGNFDGTPMHRVLAMRGAAPLARAVLLTAADGRILTLPSRPASIQMREICARSGLLPGHDCQTRREFFAPGTAPTKRCTPTEHERYHFGARYTESETAQEL